MSGDNLVEFLSHVFAGLFHIRVPQYKPFSVKDRRQLTVLFGNVLAKNNLTF